MFNQVSRKRFNKRYKRKMIISLVSWLLVLVAAIVIFILATRELARAEHPLEKYFFKSQLPDGYQKKIPSHQIAGPVWEIPKDIVYEGIVFTPTGYYHIYRPKRWGTLLAEWEKRGGNPNIRKRCFADTKMRQIWYMEKAFDLIMERVLGRLFFTPFEEIMDVTSSYKKLRAEALLDQRKIRNGAKVEFHMKEKRRRVK